MADEFDIEAMLEAPYKSAENGKSKKHDSDDDDDGKSKRSRRKRSKSRSRSGDRRRSKRSRSGERRKRRSRSGERRSRRSPSPDRRRRSPSPRRRPSRGDEKRDRDRKRRSRSGSDDSGHWQVLPRDETISAEERDRRTVFCMQLSRNIRPRDLEEFFSKVGQVRDVRIISDRNSRRSKGIAYVEFTDASAVPLALKLTGQRLLNAPIIVQETQAEKNRLAAEAEKLKRPLGPTRVYVGSLHFNITEQMIKAIFEPFGVIDTVQMIMDSETGRSKGYCFIQFRDPDSAKRAMEQMNGFELAGRPIKVGPVTERTDTGGMSFLDDEEYEKGGIVMNTAARAALMQKLSQTHSAGLTVPGAPPANPAVSILQTPVSIPLPTPCLMISNMFDPSKEQDKDWHLDIQDDVLDELSKLGGIVHIHVDQTSMQGNVYLKCVTPDIAVAAVKTMHGRYFAGKQLLAKTMPLSQYHGMFPNAAMAVKPLKPTA
ncbi:RNA-binding protein 39-like [Xenia sp. Carnegie-2017]|uniref:RNA-binding protein 39-like n=1 Tax=Xenia sp. Carnegie-2017 TaxID=2897299 RepID=UPI001F036398|nr:RNA-binding protein 39-like [Xenia sp. Carnegie-2017]